MLREYALTPHIFDSRDPRNCEREDWFDTLKGFVHRLLRLGKRTEIPGIVVSNDYGMFAKELADICMKSGERRHETALRSLQRSLQKYYVPRRDFEGNPFPGDEDDWITQVRRMAADYPVDRVVATKSMFASEETQVYGLYDLEESFWDDPDPSISLPPIIATQIKSLEKLLLFSSAIGFVCPHFGQEWRGYAEICTFHPEAEFPIQLLIKKMESPQRFPQLKRFEIITNKPDDCKGKAAECLAAQRMAEYIRARVGNSSFDICVCISKEKFIQRRVLFGEAREDDFYPRWGIFMDHYAREKDPPDGERHKFYLGKDAEISEIKSRYFPPNRLHRYVSYSLAQPR